MNKSIDRTMRQGARFIGILDIAGFEIFKVMFNSISYCIMHVSKAFSILKGYHSMHVNDLHW